MAKTKTLTCPECGWDATQEGKHDFCFRLVEEVVIIKRIEGINKAGKLEVVAEEDFDSDELAESAKIECGNCQHRFPKPKSVPIQWV